MPATSTKLPPTDRDFNIDDAVHVRGCSTYSQADLHEISQTRVRQIVRRVVEWLGEVLPPQTKVAKEQETHLARQIAADRFQHQYEQMTTFWDMTQDVKYAGIRIRLTTAQARLGVVGGLIAGLAADALEGLPVPAYEPPPEPNPSVGRGSPDPAHSTTEGLNNIPPHWLYDPIAYNELTPEIIAAREAAGCPLQPSLIQYAIEHGYLPREAAPTPPLSPSTTPQSAICNLQSEICNLPSPIPSPPPPGDCSPSNEPSPDSAAPPADLAIPTDAASTSYASPFPTPNDPNSAPQSPSQPLLTHRDPLPVTELQLTPHQPGATISSTNSISIAPSPTVPCPLA